MSDSKTKKILIVAPHMDDEVLGCGGIIAKHHNLGEHVTVIFVAHRKYNHIYDAAVNEREMKHAERARAVLGYDSSIYLNLSDERLDSCIQEIIIPLEEIVSSLQPSVVYIPFYGDNNQDHRAVFEACRVVFRPAVSGYLDSLFMYEVLSSTEQSPPVKDCIFYPNYYVNIVETIDLKNKAFSEYESEKRVFPHPRSLEAIRILAQKRGMEAGCFFAEAFMLIRGRWL